MFEDTDNKALQALNSGVKKDDYVKAMVAEGMPEDIAKLVFDAYTRGANEYCCMMWSEQNRANRAEAKLTKLSMKVVEVLFLSDDDEKTT